MLRRAPRSTRTDTLFPYTTLFRSRLLRLVPTHRGPLGQVGRSPAHVPGQDNLVAVDLGGNTDVDHPDHRPAGTGKHVDRGTPGPQLLQHAEGDLLGPRRHTLSQDDVITREHRDRRPGGVPAPAT